MTTFDDRERAYETAFVREEDAAFRVLSRRNRLAGEWVAERLGLTEVESEAYVEAVIASDFEEAGDEDIVRKLVGDLAAANVQVSADDVRALLADKAAEASAQLAGGA